MKESVKHTLANEGVYTFFAHSIANPAVVLILLVPAHELGICLYAMLIPPLHVAVQCFGNGGTAAWEEKTPHEEVEHHDGLSHSL